MQAPAIFKQTGLRKGIEMANKIILNLFLIKQYYGLTPMGLNETNVAKKPLKATAKTQRKKNFK